MNTLVTLGAACSALWLAVPLRAAPQQLTIDHRLSRIDVAVKATAHTFVVKLVDFDAVILADAEVGQVTAARFDFHFADWATSNHARDPAMRAWQQTDRFPQGNFTLTTLEPVAGNGFLARGRLTWHGVTREISFPAAITTDRKIYAIDGTLALDTRDYGLPVIVKLGVLRVNPKVTLRFHLQGSLDGVAAFAGSLSGAGAGNK